MTPGGAERLALFPSPALSGSGIEGFSQPKLMSTPKDYTKVRKKVIGWVIGYEVMGYLAPILDSCLLASVGWSV